MKNILLFLIICLRYPFLSYQHWTAIDIEKVALTIDDNGCRQFPFTWAQLLLTRSPAVEPGGLPQQLPQQGPPPTNIIIIVFDLERLKRKTSTLRSARRRISWMLYRTDLWTKFSVEVASCVEINVPGIQHHILLGIGELYYTR